MLRTVEGFSSARVLKFIASTGQSLVWSWQRSPSALNAPPQGTRQCIERLRLPCITKRPKIQNSEHSAMKELTEHPKISALPTNNSQALESWHWWPMHRTASWALIWFFWSARLFWWFSMFCLWYSPLVLQLTVLNLTVNVTMKALTRHSIHFDDCLPHSWSQQNLKNCKPFPKTAQISEIVGQQPELQAERTV